MPKNLSISSLGLINYLRTSCKLTPVIKETVYQQIIADAVRAEGIEITDFELQEAADKFRLEHNLYNPPATWEWLKKNYLTGDDFEQLIYRSLFTSKLIQHLFGKSIKPYFYEHQLDFTQAVLYEIIFDDFDIALEQFYALEEKETTFIEVARQYITEPNLRRQHGYRGVVPRTTLNSAISAAVFTANPPQILKPIEIGKKYHLILVEEIIEPELDESLTSLIASQLFSSWLEKQIQQYSIELNVSSGEAKTSS